MGDLPQSACARFCASQDAIAELTIGLWKYFGCE